MNKRKIFFGVLVGLVAFCVLLSWVSVYSLGTIATVPFGLCPLLLAGGVDSRASFIICIFLICLLYGLICFSIWGVSRRKRFGTAGILILITIDLAINVVFTVISWWYLVSIALDLMILIMAYCLYHWSGQTK